MGEIVARISNSIPHDVDELTKLRSDVIALLSSDATYLVPPGVDSVDWYADCIAGLAKALITKQNQAYAAMRLRELRATGEKFGNTEDSYTAAMLGFIDAAITKEES